MKKVVILLLVIVQSFTGHSQSDVKEIEKLLQTFMTAISSRDSVTMYSLFVDAPVTWVGAWQEASLKSRSGASTAKPYKVSDYKIWFRSVMSSGYKEELFSNPVIVQDGTVGSVTFDYSFWVDKKKGNWGKESWGLVKVNNQWKIASVIFSMELEKVRKQDAVNEIIHPEINGYLKSYADTADFNGVVLVAKGDAILHLAAYGYFDAENKITNQLSTQFLVGSLTKSFTAVGIMQLVDKGKIDLHAPLQQYIPNLSPALAKNLTVHHLLKQQLGLTVFIDDITEVEIMDISSKELLNIINKSSRRFKPGSKHEYSNINYTLLAMVIENVSGMSYADYMQDCIFIPLHMTQSGIERLTNIPPQRAIGYRDILGMKRRVQNVVSYALGSGDIYSTASDLFKWSHALQNGDLLTSKSKALLLEGGAKDWGYYGYGFRMQPYQQAKDVAKPGLLIRHGGTMNGFISNYHYYKQDDLTVIIVSNYRNTPIRSLTYRIKEVIVNGGTPRPKLYEDE